MKTLLAILLFAGNAYAGVPFWQPPSASTSTAYGTGYLSGVLKIYPSTSTAAASPSIQLNGVSGYINATSSVTALAGFYGDLYGKASGNVLKAGDSMTGGLSINAVSSATTLSVLNQRTSATNTGANIQAVGSGATENIALWLEGNLATKNTALFISSPAAGASNYAIHSQSLAQSKFLGTVAAPSGFIGPLTGNAATATSVPQSGVNLSTVTTALAGKVSITGDTMSGPLTLSGSSLTVTGNAFSVGVSSLAVKAGKLGVGTADPVQKLDVTDGVSAAPLVNSANGYVRFRKDGGYAQHMIGGYDGTPDYSGWYQVTNGAALQGLAMQPLGGAFSVGGSTLVVTGGKVGIGVTPTVPLQLASTLNGNWGAIFSNDHATGYGAKVVGGGTGTKAFEVTNYAGTPLATVLGSGNVGIGTVSPRYALDVVGAAHENISIQGGAGNVTGIKFRDVDSLNFQMYDVGSNRFDLANGTGTALTTWLPSGNVGIGDVAPQAKLTVNGNMHSSGTISAVSFVGSGAGLTGLPGGGDAVLAATQTWTGTNTFIGVSSFTQTDIYVSSCVNLGTGYTTVKSFFVDAVTNSTLTIILAHEMRVQVSFAGILANDSANQSVYSSFLVDGVAVRGAQGSLGGGEVGAAASTVNGGFTYTTEPLSTGSHVFWLALRNMTTGATTASVSSAGAPQFCVNGIK